MTKIDMTSGHEIKLSLDHGTLEGFHVRSVAQRSRGTVLVINGLNGFYSYGMTPKIQSDLAQAGFDSVAINFSHGGVEGGSDEFTRSDLYEKNCMRLEVADVVGTCKYMEEHALISERLFFLSHSLGNIPATFAMKELARSGPRVAGLAMLAPSMNLDFWGEEKMHEWRQNGYLVYRNKRTGQDLRLGEEFYQETLESDTTWALEPVLCSLDAEFLLVHGRDDESVPLDESEVILGWLEDCGRPATLHVIDEASHTFNVSHPFSETSESYEQMIHRVVEWLKDR